MADGSSFSLGKMTVDEKTGKSKINAKVMGIDVGEIVEAQVKAKEIPLKKKQETIDRQTKVLADFSDFQAKIAAVKDVVSKLSNLSSFSGAESSFGAKRANASSSNGSSYTGYVAFTVAPSAKTQNFDIEICALAKADKIIASQSSTSDLTASLSIFGSLSLSSIGNETSEILITDDMNLQSIQDAINAVSDTTKIRASIIHVGDSDYRLNLAHIETGRKITLSDRGGVLDSLHIAESGKTDQDLSAHVKFNGVNTYHRNNIITDLVEGGNY